MASRYLEEYEIDRAYVTFRVTKSIFLLALHLAKMRKHYVLSPEVEGTNFKVDAIKALRIALPELSLLHAKLLFEEAEDALYNF